SQSPASRGATSDAPSSAAPSHSHYDPRWCGRWVPYPLRLLQRVGPLFSFLRSPLAPRHSPLPHSSPPTGTPDSKTSTLPQCSPRSTPDPSPAEPQTTYTVSPYPPQTSPPCRSRPPHFRAIWTSLPRLSTPFLA